MGVGVAKWVKDKDLGLKRFVRELQSARTAFVTVGVHQGSKDAQGTDIAEYAAANEYGTDNIPDRPFMRTSFDNNVAQIQRDMAAGYASVQTGNSVFRALSTIGNKHQDRIQNIIETVDFLPRLSEATVKAKKGSTKTLIDSGAMKNSIRYVVHK
jgi:hypothetical protein